ncbi:MAG TPA: M6 family metalloprotease domain-containing protein [Gemmatimonadales bacterium]|nr:M6 family metalloprotease domain-containing protein [Gemmatimonadales bacterium]
MRALRPTHISFTIVSALFVVVPASGRAQNRVEQVRTADGLLLDFPRDGVWRVKARRVAERRAMLMAQGRFAELNAAAQGPTVDLNPPGVSGTLYMPTILIAFKDTDTTKLSRAARYDSVIYGSSGGAPPVLQGRPYSVRTFYEEMSNGMLSVRGQSFGWAVVDSNQAYYLEACGAGNDPFGCDSGRTRAGRLMRQALSRVDATVNFALFDNDGANDTPNDGDDDGSVDVVQFVQPVRGRECNTGPGYNAHRYFLAAPQMGGAYTTDDNRVSGPSKVTVNSYYIVSGIGGTACTDTTIMAIGTSAHELGHGLGLPDLYDTGLESEGIGEWGLMGSGNYRSIQSPAHFEAWSKQQMGWITVRPLTVNGTYMVGPVVTGDTVFLIRPLGSNPRGEYFLLENKQAVGSDTANMQSGTRPKGGGLAIWHIDSTKIAQGSFLNEVNSGTIHGVALVQADNLNELRNTSAPKDRGDNGDPYPGATNNTRLSYNSAPVNTKNSDGTFVGFEIASITQVSPNGPMSFQLTFGGATIVRASDTTAQVTVNGTRYRRFAQLLEVGSVHNIGIDSVQLTTDSLTQFHFDSWSDAGARNHQITAQLVGDSISASVHKRLRVRARGGGTGTGTIASTPTADVSAGVYVRKDSSIVLSATPSSGHVFDGWTGDTTTSANPLALTVSRPFTLTAVFATPLAGNAGTPPGAVMGKAYAHQLTATGGTGTYSWAVSSGALPDGLSLSSGGAISGIPSKTGSFSATARVTSGSQAQDVTVAITVTAPTLVQANVVAQILGTNSSALNADELKYLDLLGNNNGSFDVGDFLAWVNATGATPAAIADAVAALTQAGPQGLEVRR